jgi:hypothetical protein
MSNPNAVDEGTPVAREATRWQDWASFMLGLWLALSPWVCGYASDEPGATGNAAFIGIALALVSHFEVSLDGHSAQWLNFAAGAWLVAAPFVLGFATAALPAANCIAVGTLGMVLAASALSLDKEIENWWHRQSIGD